MASGNFANFDVTRGAKRRDVSAKLLRPVYASPRLAGVSTGGLQLLSHTLGVPVSFAQAPGRLPYKLLNGRIFLNFATSSSTCSVSIIRGGTRRMVLRPAPTRRSPSS